MKIRDKIATTIFCALILLFFLWHGALFAGHTKHPGSIAGIMRAGLVICACIALAIGVSLYLWRVWRPAKAKHGQEAVAAKAGDRFAGTVFSVAALAFAILWMLKISLMIWQSRSVVKAGAAGQVVTTSRIILQAKYVWALALSILLAAAAGANLWLTRRNPAAKTQAGEKKE